VLKWMIIALLAKISIPQGNGLGRFMESRDTDLDEAVE
jgi:hypothetical protein